MKMGFRIEFDKELNKKELIAAKEQADAFIARTAKRGGYGNGGWRSYLRRGTYGMSVYNHQEKCKTDLVFRRAVRNQRIFIVVNRTKLVQLDGTEINLNQCMCPLHLGGTKVKWRSGRKPETTTYYEVGDIKG